MNKLIIFLLCSVVWTGIGAANVQADVTFPYVDVKNNGKFDQGDIGKDSGVDICALIFNDGKFDTKIAEGNYVPPANPASLVIPAGAKMTTSKFKNQKFDLTAEKDVSFLSTVSLTDTDSSVSIEAGGNIHLENSTISSKDYVYIVADGSISADGATINSDLAFVEIEPEGDLSIRNAVVNTPKDSVTISSGRNFFANNTNFKTRYGVDFESGVNVDKNSLTYDQMDLSGSSLKGNSIAVWTQKSNLTMDNVTFKSCLADGDQGYVDVEVDNGNKDRKSTRLNSSH